MRKKDEKTFTLDQDNITSPVFIIQSDGFGATALFSVITSVAVEFYLGSTPNNLVKNTSLDTTLTTTAAEAWDVGTQMRYLQIKCVSGNNFTGVFGLTGVE